MPHYEKVSGPLGALLISMVLHPLSDLQILVWLGERTSQITSAGIFSMQQSLHSSSTSGRATGESSGRYPQKTFVVSCHDYLAVDNPEGLMVFLNIFMQAHHNSRPPQHGSASEFNELLGQLPIAEGAPVKLPRQLSWIEWHGGCSLS